MTNVKLKLMFFLLNSLLTADVVQARPYSDNTTDVVIKYTNSNNTFNIPVEPDSDTLVVASDDTFEQNVEEEEEENDKDDLASMMNAEQDRDEVMSEMQDHSVLAEDAATVEKRKNISSPSLHEMIDSETDREESITDLMFRPDSELAEAMPRFEFLIAGRINESDVNRTAGAKDSDDRFEKNGSDMMRKADYVELVEVMKPKMSENKSAYMVNITGHEVDNDLAPDTRFTDVQTLFLACFGTLLPLLAVLFATLLIRCMCRRWCPGCCEKPTASSVSESSEKQDGQLKSPAEESVGREGDTPPANGSIFTMTLKNNHLIVETEERNDIAKNGRETKMKYSPDNDGIFVVEVQQSTAYRPNNKCVQNATSYDTQISMNQALIHRVPEELERKKEDSEMSNDEYSIQIAIESGLVSSGLCISDTSMFSLESPYLSYAYGGQIGYEQGLFGYPIYAGYDIKDEFPEGIVCDNSQEPLILKTPTDPDKPIVTAAIFKQDSIIGSEVLQGPGYCIEGSTDGPLLSDVQAREYSLQHLHDQKEKKLENGVAVPISEKIDSPKKVLNRADSLPVRLEEDSTPEIVIVKNNYMETIKEDDIPKEFMKGKRASLPIIKTEVYESVKNEILPSVSPKFEKVANETSPCDSGFDGPPMITITEESEPGKSDSTS